MSHTQFELTDTGFPFHRREFAQLLAGILSLLSGEGFAVHHYSRPAGVGFSWGIAPEFAMAQLIEIGPLA